MLSTPEAVSPSEQITASIAPEETDECLPNLRTEIEATDSELPSASEAPAADASFWIAFGLVDMQRRDRSTGEKLELHAEGALSCTVPTGFFALASTIPDANAAVGSIARLLSSAPPLCLNSQGRAQYVYRMAHGELGLASLILPDGVQLIAPGDALPLPSGAEFDPNRYPYRRLSDLPATTEMDLDPLRSPQLEPAVKGSPFASFSLLGRSAEYEALAVAAVPLLGVICLTGQATIWYAPPNAGKTLISLKLLADAVMAKRINPANVYYINADDSSQGLADKLSLMDELGIHTLVPGHRGFKPDRLAELLRQAAADGKARGALVIIDTVKKFTSLMDKAKASAFADACRAFVMAGGTVVGFAHTNKKPSADGSLTYSGTTDLLDDFDAAYILTPMQVEDHNETAVTFRYMKRRGGNAETATFAYARDSDISYAERLASVREVDPNELEGFRRREVEQDSGAVIAVVQAHIAKGVVGKMALAKDAAREANVSERSVIRVLDEFAGDDPDRHHWRVTRGARGVRQYEVLSRPEAMDDEPPT